MVVTPHSLLPGRRVILAASGWLREHNLRHWFALRRDPRCWALAPVFTRVQIVRGRVHEEGV